jgi:hypothetical protein
MNWQICPGIGIGDLIFGASRAEVEAILGIPDKIDSYDLSGKATFAWYYPSKGISAHFDEDDSYCLGLLAVSNPKANLNGVYYIGLTKEQLLQEAKDQKWGEVEVDDEQDYIIIDSLALTFWIEENEVASIQCSTLLNDNGKNIWPPHS